MRFAVHPSTDKSDVRPLPGASSLRPCAATRLTCSARVVSHHLDGFLRSSGHGFVAPRSQPWVHRVSRALRSSSHPKATGDRPHSSRRGSHPSKISPRRQQAPHHCGPLPSCRYQRCPSVGPTEADLVDSPQPKPGGPVPHLRGGVARCTGRQLDPVMLRSAEADPHVTAARPAAGRSQQQTCRTTVHPKTEVLVFMAVKSWPKGAYPPPSSRGWLRASAEAPMRAVYCRSSRPPRVQPPDRRSSRGTDLSRRREQPTSRLCSADESVAPLHRCQRSDTRSFHGLGSSPRSSKFRSSANDTEPQPPARPKPSPQPTPAQAPEPLESLRQFSPATPRGEHARRKRGPKPTTNHAPFQRLARSPKPRTEPSRAEARSRTTQCRWSLSGDRVRCATEPEMPPPLRQLPKEKTAASGSPLGQLTDLHEVC
jgi:hypothetical protein